MVSLYSIINYLALFVQASLKVQTLQRALPIRVKHTDNKENNKLGTTTEELFTYGDGNTLALRSKDQLTDKIFIVTNWEVDYSNVVEADSAITITLEVIPEVSYIADDFSEVSKRYISIGFSELINLYNKG